MHHGNQGLTYSEVFYGQEPLENTGFDEVLEVHQATNIPGNFHLSGTLMPAAEWHNPEFNDWLVSGINDGYVSMLTSALGQHGQSRCSPVRDRSRWRDPARNPDPATWPS